MKIGDLVMVILNTHSVVVLLEEVDRTELEEVSWVVHWFDDNEWSWELEKDLKVVR